MEEKRITLIERYLNGLLNKTEAEAFEKKLITDKDFAMEVEQFKDLVGGLRLRNNKALKNRLNEIHNQVIDSPEEAKVRPLNRRYLYAIIAAASILLLVSVFLFRNGKTSPEAVYASHYTPYEIDWNTRGTDMDKVTENIKNFYEAKNYKELAVLLAADSVESKLSDSEFSMIKGITLLENGDFDKARLQFSTAAKNPIVRQDAQWYAALSYLKQNDIESCKKILKRFVENENSDYYKEAREMLGSL